MNDPCALTSDRTKGSGRFAIRFAATDRDVRNSLILVRRSLAEMGVEPDDIAVAELVLAEALNNVVEHACRDCANKMIDLAICLARRQKAGCLQCRIRDTGMPMPGGHPPMGRRVDPSAGIDDLPEGGFGWMLIRELSVNVRYCRVEGENQLCLDVPIGRRRQTLLL